MGKYFFQKIICLLFALAAGLQAHAAILKVRENSNLFKIQSAIDNANSGDTIYIYPGNYFEKNIVIKKPLVVIGIDKPVIDGEKKYEILSVMSSDVTIEGIEFRNGGRSSSSDIAGIKVYFSKNVTIRNNILNEMFFGIYLQACSNCLVKNNTVNSSGNTEIQSGNGIHCWKCNEISIENNVISGQRDGIYFEFVTNSMIIENKSRNNIRYGLHFMFSHNNIYRSNIFSNNGAGVAVMYTHNVTMINNTFSNNWGSSSYGLLMKDISDSHVENNNFTGNTTGIYMEGSSRIKIMKNNFKDNGYALKIQSSCDDNEIRLNNFISNTFDVTTNGTLVQNKFEKNYWDKYEGYDLNHDGIGDVPHHPINMYSMIIEKMPVAMIFFRSFMVNLLDKTEKAVPSITPENFLDNKPMMKQIKL